MKYRTKEEQIPDSIEDREIVKEICEYFREDPHGFEKWAAELFLLLDRNAVSYDLTRPWVDGDRDAIGKYRIGLDSNAVSVEFALEAKCYQLNGAVGVSSTSRLISRLRYRQFGVLVTTSFVHH